MEQRHYARLKSNLDAQFITPNSQRLDCTIIDFCIHGMRLSVPGASNLSEEYGLTAGMRILVQYNAKWNNQQKMFEVVGLIAQVSTQEIGVKVPAFQPEAFQAIRSSNAHQPLAKRSAHTPQDIEQIMTDSAKHLQKMIAIATDKLFDAVDLRLQSEHDAAISLAEQATLKYIIKRIRESKEKIRNELVTTAHQRFYNKEVAHEKTKIKANELSLVAHSEIDDWIQASSISTKLDEAFNQDISKISQRLANASNQEISDKQNPFTPSSLFEIFRSTLNANTDIIDNEQRVKKIIYEELGKVIKEDYPSLIQDLDTILPDYKKNKTLTAAKTKPTTITSDEKNSDHKVKKQFEETLSSLKTLINDQKNHTPQAQPDAGNNPSQQETKGLTHGLLQSLRNISAHLMGKSAPIKQTADGYTTIPDNVIADVIDQLDIRVDQADITPLSQRIEASVNQGAESLRLMSEKEREALDMLSILYDRGMKGAQRTGKIGQLVEELEKPLLKSTLKDPSIPVNRDHPARHIVNLIEQFSIAADENGQLRDHTLQENLDKVVQRITKEYEKGDSAYLETVKASLEHLLDPLQRSRTEKIAAMQDNAEASQRKREAHRKVAEYLEARFADHDVAELIEQLLDEGWQQYLVMIVMRDGMNGVGWQQGEIALERLMTWSDVNFKPTSKHKYEITAWLAMVERQLSLVNLNSEKLKIFMAHAKKLLEQTTLPEAKILARKHIHAGRFAEKSISPSAMHSRFGYLIDRLKIGEWWDFLSNQEWIPMQLIWLSQPPGSMLFTNRAASRTLELSLEDFEKQIDQRTVRAGTDLNLPMLERAEHIVINENIHQLQHQATHSHIPGLWNRNGFMLNLKNVSKDRRKMDQLHVLMIIGFDQIGMIYTQRGMEAGDELIKKIAISFTSQLRKEDIIAVFNEGSFALLLLNVDKHYTQDVANKIMSTFKDFRFSYEDETYSIGVNMGLVSYTPSIISPEEGIRRADAAYSAAIKLGRNTLQWYEDTDALIEEQKILAKWAGKIDRLFMEDKLYLRSQLIIPLASDLPYKPRYEILIGIRNETSDNKSIPGEFIPVLERLRRIHELDLWVLRKFFDWAIQNEGIIDASDGFSINISALSLSNFDLTSLLHDVLADNENIAQKLCFEITETVAIEGYNAAQNFISQIKNYGCRFSIDDFGSGHASYTHLKNLSTDELKIDGFFVRDIANNPKDYAMVKSMNEIAHSLNMRTVAEHVESIEAVKCLREIGVDYVQGFYIAEPVPLVTLSQNH